MASCFAGLSLEAVHRSRHHLQAELVFSIVMIRGDGSGEALSLYKRY